MLALAFASSLAGPERLLWDIGVAGYALLLLKLWRAGLMRTYPFFSSYLAYSVARGAALHAFKYGTNAYAWAYFLSEPVFWLAYILVVLELYSLVLRNYPGIASLGRWVLVAGLFASILISGLSLQADLSNPGEKYPVILYFTVIGRGVIFSLVIFLLLITGFLVSYPVPLSRNVIVHSMVWSLYFLSTTAGLLVRNITGHQVTADMNLALLAASLACLVAWIVALSPAGEGRTIVLRHIWRPEQQQRLMDQLSAINSTLLRTARRLE
jgi:hypothetical protein